MNNLKLIITDEAYSDIEKISDFIAQDNKDAAKSLVGLLYKTCRTLTKFPLLGTLKTDLTGKDIRIFILQKQYLIAYKIDNGEIVILKITNRYQDISTLL